MDTEEYIMGIDPGKKGGHAILCLDGNPKLMFEMPLYPNGEIDTRALFESIKHMKINLCFIEKAQAMPKQGITSTFNYGRGYGKLQALLEILNIPFQEIRPAEWKKYYSLSKASKEESITLAQKLFPFLPKDIFYTPRGRKKDGIAEALLIAEYCRRKTN